MEFKTLKEKIEATTWLDDNLDLQALDCTLDASDDSDIELDDFIEQATNYIQESVQIIYYHNAIKFLQENDASLYESIELAEEFCTPLKNINSEFLATILLQKYCLDELAEIN
jgi:hypothetical protein